MPAITKASTKKDLQSKKSPLTAEKPVSTTPAKRKAVSKKDEGEPELEAEVAVEAKEERKVKKLKGKEKEKAEEKVEESVTKKKAVKEVKEKEEKKSEKKKKSASKEKKVEKEEEETKPAKKTKTSSKTKSKKAPSPSPEPSDAEEVAEKAAAEEETGSGAEDEVLLTGFSSESDSSDEDDDDDVDGAPVDMGKLPTIAKDDATVKRKLEKAKRQATEDRGVLYIGRIPHGFYEDQMKAYFSQFGDVTRLRLSRSKKTGRSKHYAFIEFSSSAVAEIVAETMDNYLLLGHILRCKVVPKEEVHPELWIGANRKFKRVPMDRVARQQQNKTRTEEEKKNVERRLIKRQLAKKRKLQAVGIDYDFGVASYAKKAKQSA